MSDILALTGGRPDLQKDKAEHITGLYSKNGSVKMRIFADRFERNLGAKPPYMDLD